MASRRFVWSKRSLSNLEGVHPDLRKVCDLALQYCETSAYDFIVIDGKRTMEEQIRHFKNGASQTLNSRHLYGLAVDIAALVDGKVRWEAVYYKAIHRCFLKASRELDVKMVWGGKWKMRDWGHFELSRGHYPNEWNSA